LHHRVQIRLSGADSPATPVLDAPPIKTGKTSAMAGVTVRDIRRHRARRQHRQLASVPSNSRTRFATTRQRADGRSCCRKPTPSTSRSNQNTWGLGCAHRQRNFDLRKRPRFLWHRREILKARPPNTVAAQRSNMRAVADRDRKTTTDGLAGGSAGCHPERQRASSSPARDPRRFRGTSGTWTKQLDRRRRAFRGSIHGQKSTLS